MAAPATALIIINPKLNAFDLQDLVDMPGVEDPQQFVQLLFSKQRNDDLVPGTHVYFRRTLAQRPLQWVRMVVHSKQPVIDLSRRLTRLKTVSARDADVIYQFSGPGVYADPPQRVLSKKGTQSKAIYNCP